MERTVRYENQVWNIDIANNELYLPNQKKSVRVNIDEVFDDLSDKDQNKIATLFAEGNDMTEEEMTLAWEESQEDKLFREEMFGREED